MPAPRAPKTQGKWGVTRRWVREGVGDDSRLSAPFPGQLAPLELRLPALSLCFTTTLGGLQVGRQGLVVRNPGAPTQGSENRNM